MRKYTKSDLNNIYHASVTNCNKLPLDTQLFLLPTIIGYKYPALADTDRFENDMMFASTCLPSHLRSTFFRLDTYKEIYTSGDIKTALHYIEINNECVKRDIVEIANLVEVNINWESQFLN